MRRVTLLSLACLLAGCANQTAKRETYLDQFIGQPDSAVVQAMGVPARTYETDGVRYLAYNEHRIDIAPATPTHGPWFYGWVGGGFPPQVIEWYCETTFKVSDGKIATYTLHGNACG
jgi:hypothetical protein